MVYILLKKINYNYPGNSNFTILEAGKLFFSKFCPNSSNSSSPFNTGLLLWQFSLLEFAVTKLAIKNNNDAIN